eukprot:gene15879-17479_t
MDAPTRAMADDLRSLETYHLDLSTLPVEVDFDLCDNGVEGDVDVIKRTNNGFNLQSNIPVGLPPLYPDLKDELEQYLLHPEQLQINDYQRLQQFWEREQDPESLFQHGATQNKYALQMERNLKTGQISGFKEVSLSDVGRTAKNSLSFSRQPGPLSDSVKGNSSNFPFLPGGFGVESMEQLNVSFDNDDVEFDTNYLDVPPGFSNPVEFEKAQKAETQNVGESRDDAQILDIADIFSGDINVGDLDESYEENAALTETPKDHDAKETEEEETDAEILVVEDASSKDSKPGEEWVVIEDTTRNVDDFHRLVPDMAYKWPFELDTFQKQAVLHLERHECVFVAAHTSAGKTVVAEYAIALAQRHMTKTIYTSPIKALSNQKFRDFKNTFEDVGILTGDVQIRPEASCLVMTTEILRSMLYNGSDTVRDIEWVIFDEVHYINDATRGVVWEEVLIMLPDHVGIVLLSATVPNTYEFADWIGRTKKKKIYVISTMKRPVPLEHHLFTGNSNKTLKELFLLVDSNGNFQKRGHQAAVDAKKARESKSNQNFGVKGMRTPHQKQDRSVWQTVIEMLRQKDQLPVVAFTFSRKQCDNSATQLTSIDLTSKSEKSSIHVFIQKCVARLKGLDKQLPQVVWMQELLKRGIGVHHSGILPILKEMVEILFQKGLVKLLFATETFAMGVNMPARTVVFDNIRKHDGKGFRELLPSEYIQMAGRAGRRGLDSTGMVIILCKSDVPDIADLHRMMLGKATLLQSQFRLTYSMILNLLRVEQLTVEEMMKRSFAESSHQKNAPEYDKKLQSLKEAIDSQLEFHCQICGTDIQNYYSDWKKFNSLKSDIQATVLSSQAGLRSLSSGRVVVVCNKEHRNKLAIILQQSSLKQQSSLSKDPLDKLFTVLMMCDNGPTHVHCSSQLVLSAEDVETNPLVTRRLFVPENMASQIVCEVRGSDIAFITSKTIKTDSSRVIDDHNKRQIPRFRDDPPSQTTVKAGQELLRLVESDPNGLPLLDPIKDFNLKNLEFVEKIKKKNQLENSINGYNCIDCPQFVKHFSLVRSEMDLTREMQHVKYLLSNDSLVLLPEYQQRIKALKVLKYIDEEENVKLKGRVACGISNNELIITELVFDNVLTHLHPSEIVALLSCFVCESRRCSQPDLTETLQQGVDTIKQCATVLARIQIDCGMSMTKEEYLESFNFGLVQVVYEWARGMPFKEITELTDVSEGIIVRCIQRLDETCRDVRNAARIIGDPDLVDKMEIGSSLIKRDIVFAGSLYTS